jgi:hypothetical protein
MATPKTSLRIGLVAALATTVAVVLPPSGRVIKKKR